MAITVAGPSGLDTIAPRQIPPAPVGYGRAYGSTTAFVKRQGYLQPAHGAAWKAYVPGTTTPTSEPLYAHATDTTPITFPHYADERGIIEFWAASPVRVEVESSLPGYPPDKAIVDCTYPEGLTIADLDPIYVNVVGDTMTGPLRIYSDHIPEEAAFQVAVDGSPGGHIYLHAFPSSRSAIAFGPGKTGGSDAIITYDGPGRLQMQASLVPEASWSRTLGDSARRWRELWGQAANFNGVVTITESQPLVLEGLPHTERAIRMLTLGDPNSDRFRVGIDASTEGTNSGSDYFIDRYTLAGGKQRVMTITRQTGVTTFGPQVAMTGGFAAVAPSTIDTTLAIGGKLVQPSPDAGNTLTWQANGFMVAGGGGGGVDIATGDARWVNVPGDSMTGALTITVASPGDALALNGSAVAGYRSRLVWKSNNSTRWDLTMYGTEPGVPQDTGGDLLLNSYYDNGSFKNHAVIYVSRKNKAIAFHGTTPKDWNTNYSVLQHGYSAWRMGPGASMNMALSTNLWVDFNGNWASMVSGSYGLLDLTPSVLRWSSGSAPGIDSVITPTLRWVVDAAGNMGLGRAPEAWDTTWNAVRMGTGGALQATTSPTSTVIQMQSNCKTGPGGANTAIIAGNATAYSIDDAGYHHWYNVAAPVAAGASLGFQERMTLGFDGHLFLGGSVLTWMAGWPAISVGGTASLGGTTGADGCYLRNNTYVNAASQNVAIVTGPSIGLNLANGTFAIFAAASVTAGAPVNLIQRLNMSNEGAVYLSPAAATASLYWGSTTGSLTNAAANPMVRSLGAQNLVLYGAGGYVHPDGDAVQSLGAAGARWANLYVYNAPVVGSHVSIKEDFAPLDPAACVAAVLTTDWISYRVKPPGPLNSGATDDDPEKDAKDEANAKAYVEMLAETAYTRQQNGYVLGHETLKVHDLFGLPDRASRSDGADLAVVACALQDALRRLAVLEGKPV